MARYTPGWRSHDTRRKFTMKPRHKESLRVGLALIAIILILTIVVWPQLQQKFLRLPPLETKSLFEKNPKIANKLINPEMISIDHHGHPFTVRARHALQSSPTQTVLDHPSGDFLMEDGTPVHFDAEQGHFYPQTNTLQLTGDVKLVTKDGYTFTTSAADIDLASGQGHGNHPLEGEGPNHERIVAEGFKLDPNSGKIVFLGKTDMTLPSSTH